jgi:predicted small metal-binding protein
VVRTSPLDTTRIYIMTKEEFRQHNCPMCGFMVRAKTDEEILEHAKYHVAHAHGVIALSPEMAKKIIESTKLVTVYVP